MQSEEQRLIAGLFQRLKEVEQNSRARDTEADQQIQVFIQQQPAAPYYMAQSILIQEAALNRLNQKIQQLQNEIAKLQVAKQQARRGFFSELFGSRRSQRSPQSTLKTCSSEYNDYTPYSNINISRGSSFLSGALQTAAGVAGGVVLGNMLTNMFFHSSSQDIINIIDDPTSVIEAADLSLNNDVDAGNLDIFDNVSEHHFLDQNNSVSNNIVDMTEWSNDDDEFI